MKFITGSNNANIIISLPDGSIGYFNIFYNVFNVGCASQSRPFT